MSRILEIEWSYLTPEVKLRALDLMTGGVRDINLAIEMAILELGEDKSFILPVEDKDETRRA